MTNILSVMEMSGDDYQRLADAIDARRVDLDLTWGELAEQANVSRTTFDNIRKGRLPRKLTQRRIEDALGWLRGSINNILAGGDPTLVAVAAAETSAESRYTPAGYLAAIFDEHAEQYGEEVLQEAWRLRESKKDVT